MNILKGFYMNIILSCESFYNIISTYLYTYIYVCRYVYVLVTVRAITYIWTTYIKLHWTSLKTYGTWKTALN